jgi:hypothetical protein
MADQLSWVECPEAFRKDYRLQSGVIDRKYEWVIYFDCISSTQLI